MSKTLTKLIYSIGIVLLTISLATAQSGCKKMKDRCEGYGEPFKYSGQSKSGTFELGQTASFKMTTYGGFEYSVSLCAEKQLKGISFMLRGIKMVTGLTLDYYFTQNRPAWIKFIDSLNGIEVDVPEGDTSKGKIDYEDTIGCIAVIIEYNKVGKKGFH